MEILKAAKNSGALLAAAVLLLTGAPRAQEVPVPEKPSHAGAKYGHADSSLGELLVSTCTTAHFVFHFAEKKAGLNDVFAGLEDNYARVTRVFNIRPAARLNVEIYPDIKTYHRRTFGENSPDWMVGNFDPDENVLRITSPNSPGSYHKYADVVRAAVHEFVHSVTFEYCGRSRAGLPVWLDEGISVYYQGPMDPAVGKRVKDAVAADKVPAIADLEEDFLKYGGYAFSPTVVEFIVKKYGEEPLRLFLKDPSSYERTFGMSRDEFSAAWRKYLKNKYR